MKKALRNSLQTVDKFLRSELRFKINILSRRCVVNMPVWALDELSRRALLKKNRSKIMCSMNGDHRATELEE